MTTQLQAVQMDMESTQIEGSKLHNLFKIGGISSLIVGTLLIIEMIFYFVTSAPSLTDASGWFAFFQNNRLVGLVDFGILELYGLVLFVPMFLALFAAIRQASESSMTIATVLALIGIAVNFATSKLFSLLTLSDLFMAATTEILKSQFLAAGQEVLALGALGGIGGSVEGGIPLAIAGLIISVVVLRSNILDKPVGYVGIMANGTGLVMFINAAVKPALNGSPFFGAFFMLSVTWFFLIGRSLFKLGISKKKSHRKIQSRVNATSENHKYL
jgi:hypothetical protein